MDKKKYSEDLRGFEDFIESQPGDTSFLPKVPKKEASFEHFTFLTNDSARLLKLKNLMSKKLPFAQKFDQGQKIIIEQNTEIAALKAKLFELCDANNSPYRKSLSEIFNSFYAPPQA